LTIINNIPLKVNIKNEFLRTESKAIHPRPHWARLSGLIVGKKKLNLLKDLINENDLSVVVVSSWTHRLKGHQNVCDFLGIPCYGEEGSFSGGFVREKRIKQHVIDNEIKDYIVIDDAGDNGYTDMKNLITVDGSVGLTKEDILKANKIFKRNKRKRKPA
jgi:hypothetical protein